LCFFGPLVLSYFLKDYLTLMTLKRPNINKYTLRASLPLAGLGIVAAALSGCGGATSGGATAIPTPDSGPVLYGINALAARSGSVTAGETSGLSFTPAGGTLEGAIVGAFAYNTVNGAGPLPSYVSSFPNAGGKTAGVPLGFPQSGGSFYYNSAAQATALPTNFTGNITFGVYASQGAKGGSLVDINPASIVLTSSESPTFSAPMIFDPNFGTDGISQSQYKTAPFTVPAFMQTTGLHDLHATIADTAGQSSTTDFAVATVDPTSVALFLQSINVLVPAVAATATTLAKPATVVNTAINPGDLVTIDGGAGTGVYPAGYTPTVADAQGTVVLFAKPGTHTVTETDPTGKTTVQTETFTLASTTAGTSLLNPPTPDGAPAGSARPLVTHPAAKSAIKRF